ncbi:hypothetical protein BDV98DRAFT_411084 [Pterulicium gracile]|uniref:Uncharacterized protein n=1 Tax=Pterulicium gracile TaxID=1884261 RepID=A0A5C3QRS2_9AGAR|nr:hypothetical protein BDV98DRAFT_411084 [Pterula gracilis]
MATSLAPPAVQQGRISQLLPSVKCSNCSQPVPLSELGDHVCSPANAAAPKAAGPSRSTALAGRLQDLVVPPPRQAIPTAPLSAGLPRTSSPSPAQPSYQRPRVSSVSSSHSSNSAHSGRMVATPSPLAREMDQPARMGTPSYDNASMNRGASPAPSMHSMRGGLPSSPGSTRMRTMSNASSIRTPPPQMPPPQGLPPPTPRVNTPSHQHVPPSPASPRFQNRQPSSSYFPPQPQPPSIHEQQGYGGAPPSSPFPPPQDPDTKIGGEAGMAGVGRRGFAAVARAAMFTQHQPFHHPQYPPQGVDGSLALPPGGMGNRRGGSPGNLDIDTIHSFPSTASASTPPLSPNSGYSSPSPGPMPLSPQSVSPPGTALGSRSPSPGITPIPDRQHKGSFGVPFSKNGLVSPLNVASPSSVTQPPPSPNVSSQQQRERRSSLSQSESDDDEPIDFGLFGGDDESRAAHSRNNSTQRRAASLNSDSSGSEYGLAYADDTDEEDAASVVNTPDLYYALALVGFLDVVFGPRADDPQEEQRFFVLWFFERGPLRQQAGHGQ